jgi:hypothetical protein
MNLDVIRVLMFISPDGVVLLHNEDAGEPKLNGRGDTDERLKRSDELTAPVIYATSCAHRFILL